jgi:predicted  nucleic acid-binding Zn-ribbon protein
VNESRESELAAEAFYSRVSVDLSDAEEQLREARKEEVALKREVQSSDVKAAAAAKGGLQVLRERKVPELQMAIKLASERLNTAQTRLRNARGPEPEKAHTASAEGSHVARIAEDFEGAIK